MYELWADKKDPAVRLVVPRGAGLPADLGPRDWLLLGPTVPEPELERQVAAHGYHFFRSAEPLPDSDTLKDSGAAGA